jgi:steroid delta-isomerase-like uncharacterized protein
MTLVQDKPTTIQDNNATTTAANTATIKQWVTQMAKGDLDHAPYAEDAEASDPNGKYKGKAQIIQFFKAWKTAFPQATGVVTNQIAMGDHVTSEVVFKTTHTGPLVSAAGTIPATNKPLELNVVLVNTFRNGLIQRERAYFDQADFMRQLGIALPPKP